MSVEGSDARSAHAAGVQRLLASYRAIPPNATVRLAKPTSNLFRARAKSKSKGLDTSGLTGVIAVDPDARTADVAGMCTYEELVAATLPHGLSPLVVPQLKTITLGGAVTGLGIESTSFRNGLPHESVLEMDILTGTGDVLTVSPDQHSDLYRAFPNSYGTLGYSVRLKIELEPVKPFVALNHLRFHSLQDLVAAMDRIIETGGIDGTPVDYVDGVVFSSDEGYLTCGRSDRAHRGRSATTPVSRSTTGPSSIRTARSTTGSPSMTTCGDGTPTGSGAPGRSARRTRASAGCGRGAIGAAASTGSSSAMTSASTSPIASRSATADRPASASFRTSRCPSREPPSSWTGSSRLSPSSRSGCVRCAFGAPADWPLYPIRPHHTYVNVGFWSSVPVGPTEGHTNRLIERKVSELDGHKSLYSDAYYSQDEFDELYGGEAYKTVKKTYDPDSRLLDLYAKAVQRR